MTLPWRVRWMYGLGQLPEGVKTAAFGFFLLFSLHSILCIGFYNITRAQHAETLASLSRRTPDGTIR